MRDLMRFVDNRLDGISMYRLMLYYLIALIAVAMLQGSLGILPYTPISILGSVLFLSLVCFLTNKIFSIIYKAPTNVESAFISALILSLLMSPLATFNSLPILGLVGFLAMASKYILAINKKHIFNPVAIAAVVLSISTGVYADWWVGNTALLPFVLLGGFLVMRKTRCEYMILSLFLVGGITSSIYAITNGQNPFVESSKTLFLSAFCFLGFIMFTEPLTSPPKQTLRILYGGIVGFLFAQRIHFGTFYVTGEMALVIGNIFSYLVSPKQKLLLYLKEKIQVAPDIIDFVFKLDKPLAFVPGQYMEFTLAHPKTDSRGSRRYFTLASSPTEDTLRLGVKFYEKGSSFKRSLSTISGIVPVIASQLSGEFVLPKDKNRKLVFIAGGIGVTPFRSIIKYLLDTKEKRQVTILYANKIAADIVYRDIFDQAGRELGIKTVYALTDKEHLPSDWQGRVGRIDAETITQEIPDWKERYFYLSGPHAMVTGYEEVLLQMGLPKRQIKKDFFPGYA